MLTGGKRFAHGGDSAFFQAGDLGLGDAQGAGNFHLGLAGHKPQLQDLFFPATQALEGRPQRDSVHPGTFSVFGIV